MAAKKKNRKDPQKSLEYKIVEGLKAKELGNWNDRKSEIKFAG